MKNNGFTLIELMVVIGISGILLAIASLNFNQWQRKNNLERQVNEIYLEINEARHLAITTRQTRSVTFNANSLVFKRYSTENDAAGVIVKTKNMIYPVTKSAWTSPNSTDILFTTKGVMNDPIPKSICMYSDLSPERDSLVIVQTRVAAGKLISQGGSCGTANIKLK